MFGETYGGDSVCLEQGRGWQKITDNSGRKSTLSVGTYGGGCYEVVMCFLACRQKEIQYNSMYMLIKVKCSTCQLALVWTMHAAYWNGDRMCSSFSRHIERTALCIYLIIHFYGAYVCDRYNDKNLTDADGVFD